ncbi:MAG: hypothetical protein Q8P59_02200, partial [Dehalococcoidia bacterium]|nr:hypothetical protein [Dehalococcoidia bacterium]
ASESGFRVSARNDMIATTASPLSDSTQTPVMKEALPVPQNQRLKTGDPRRQGSGRVFVPGG